MDANQNDTRETVTVSIAGREVKMFKPSNNQIIGLNMMQSDFLPEGQKLSGLTDMFLLLLPDDAARGWFMSNLLADRYSLDDLMVTLKAIITAPADGSSKAPKKTAKKAP